MHKSRRHLIILMQPQARACCAALSGTLSNGLNRIVAQTNDHSRCGLVNVAPEVTPLISNQTNCAPPSTSAGQARSHFHCAGWPTKSEDSFMEADNTYNGRPFLNRSVFINRRTRAFSSSCRLVLLGFYFATLNKTQSWRSKRQLTS